MAENEGDLFGGLIDDIAAAEQNTDPGEDGGKKGQAGEADKEKPGEGSPGAKKVDEQYNKLQKSYKDLQEHARQQSEKLKELSEWKQRIQGEGPSDEDKAKAQREELIKRLDEDPYAVIDIINQKVEERLAGLENKVELGNRTSQIKEVMHEIDKEYEVDWDKNWNKILEQISYFSAKAVNEMPKEVLKNACRLAGCLKPREHANIPYVEGMGPDGSPPQKKNEVDAMKERILSKKPKGDALDFLNT